MNYISKKMFCYKNENTVKLRTTSIELSNNIVGIKFYRLVYKCSFLGNKICG